MGQRRTASRERRINLLMGIGWLCSLPSGASSWKANALAKMTKAISERNGTMSPKISPSIVTRRE
jgi:hypothetical protein